jgi:pilus assembly protein Flp/PilA
MLTLLRRVIKNQHGASVVELTMIVSLIAVAAIASMRSVSTKVSIVLGTLN